MRRSVSAEWTTRGMSCMFKSQVQPWAEVYGSIEFLSKYVYCKKLYVRTPGVAPTVETAHSAANQDCMHATIDRSAPGEPRRAVRGTLPGTALSLKTVRLTWYVAMALRFTHSVLWLLWAHSPFYSPVSQGRSGKHCCEYIGKKGATNVGANLAIVHITPY